MSKRHVDQLLRRAFRDDMPPEFEEQMHLRIRELWRQASETSPVPAQEQDSAATSAWAPRVMNLRRALLVACALVMMISGGVLRIGHTSSFLTESFALRETAFLVIGRLERARRMECRLQTRDERGLAVRYSISWVEGRSSRVEMEGPAGKEIGFASAQRMQMSIVNFPRQAWRNQPVGSRSQERWFEPIREFLNAPAVAGLMTGHWSISPVQDSGEIDRAAFVVTAHPYPGLARVVVDLHTYLPVSLAYFPVASGAQILNSQPLVSAEFRWENQSVSPRQP